MPSSGMNVRVHDVGPIAYLEDAFDTFGPKAFGRAVQAGLNGAAVVARDNIWNDVLPLFLRNVSQFTKEGIQSLATNGVDASLASAEFDPNTGQITLLATNSAVMGKFPLPPRPTAWWPLGRGDRLPPRRPGPHRVVGDRAARAVRPGVG